MKRCVVDTNVPVVANGRDDDPNNPVRVACKEKAIHFLVGILKDGTVLLDAAGEIWEEYCRRLSPDKRQPGVGDLFFRKIIQEQMFERIDLPKVGDNFTDLHRAIVKAGFDPDDRKFAAISVKEGVPVVNAVDSDWVEHRDILEAHGVQIEFLCGCDTDAWRDRADPQ